MRFLIPIFILFPLALVFGNLLNTPVFDFQSTKGVKVATYTKDFANVHLVETNGKFLLIDAGMPGDSLGLLSFLQEQHVKPEQINYLVITHAHPDHAGNAAFLQRNFSTPIIAGAGDSLMIAKLGNDEHLCPRGLEGQIIKRTIASQTYAPFKVDISVDSLFDLNTIGWDGAIQIVPSHTRGSLAIHIKDVVFVGDLIKGGNLRRQRPTFHIFMCDLEKNIQDIESVATYSNAEHWFLGHFGPLERADVLKFITQQKRKLN